MISLPLCGYIVQDGHMLPDPERISAITVLTPPSMRLQLRGFLGVTGYYHQFIKGYAAIAWPLTTLLKEDSIWDWEKKQQAAFD